MQASRYVHRNPASWWEPEPSEERQAGCSSTWRTLCEAWAQRHCGHKGHAEGSCLAPSRWQGQRETNQTTATQLTRSNGGPHPGYPHLCLRCHNRLLTSPLAFTLTLPTIRPPPVAQASFKILFVSSGSFLHPFNKLSHDLSKSQLPYYNLQSPRWRGPCSLCHFFTCQSPPSPCLSHMELVLWPLHLDFFPPSSCKAGFFLVFHPNFKVTTSKRSPSSKIISPLP